MSLALSEQLEELIWVADVSELGWDILVPLACFVAVLRWTQRSIDYLRS